MTLPVPLLVTPATLKLVATATAAVLFVLTLVGHLVAGPARWVKVSTALLVVAAAIAFGAWWGWLPAAGIASFVVVSSVVMMAVAGSSWRQPRRPALVPAEPEERPAHARKAMDSWGAELAALGFQPWRDGWFAHQAQGREQRTFTRVFKHGGRPVHAVIAAMDSMPSCGRVLVSTDAGGRTLLTADRMPDAWLFDDPLTHVQWLTSGTSCAKLLEAHEATLRSRELRATIAPDPAAAHVERLGAWLDRLVAKGQLVERGQEVAIAPRHLPRAVARILGSWFR